MRLSDIRIVLVATTHPGNIGSTARALKTMGLSQLYLVTPKKFPDRQAVELAAGADDILDQCVITDSLEEALQGCQLALATSARPRDLALPGLTPATCAELVAKQPDNTSVAIVFGREHAGLTNEELLRCHFHVNIPSNPDYSSLNLAQAVQIIAYELRIKLHHSTVSVACHAEPLANVEDVDYLYEHLWKVLTDIQFLKPENPGKVKQRIRRFFSRVNLEVMEVNILRGILTQIQKVLVRASE